MEQVVAVIEAIQAVQAPAVIEAAPVEQVVAVIEAIQVVQAPAVIEVVPTQEIVEADEIVDSVTETPIESSGEVNVGTVRIPIQLYLAFVNEASTFQSALNLAIMDTLAGTRTRVDFEVMRMAHSLAGVGRATGLSAVSHLAEKVEAWASINMDRQIHLTDKTRAVLMDAMEALGAMVDGVEEKLEPMMEYTIVARLSLLINEDERRIAMAKDIRPDVTASVIDHMPNEADVDASDNGIAPSSSVFHPPQFSETEPQHPRIEVIEYEQTEVAKAPGPFCLDNNTSDTASSTIEERIEARYRKENGDSTFEVTSVEDRIQARYKYKDFETIRIADSIAKDSHSEGSENATPGDCKKEDQFPIVAGESDQGQQGAHLDLTEHGTARKPNAEDPILGLVAGHGLALFPSNDAEALQVPALSPGNLNDIQLIKVESIELSVATGVHELPENCIVYTNTSLDSGCVPAQADAGGEDGLSGQESIVRPCMDEDVRIEKLNDNLTSVPVSDFQTINEIDFIADHDAITSWKIPPTVQGGDQSNLLSAYIAQRAASNFETSSGLDWMKIISTREDDVDSEMFEIFFEEANERFEEVDNTLNVLQNDITDKRQANILKRALHTLKGSANTAGCRKVGVIFHCLEDLMESVRFLSVENVAYLQSGVDAAFAGLKAMRSGKSIESAIQKISSRVIADNVFNESATIPSSSFSSHLVINNSRNEFVNTSDEHENTTASVVTDTSSCEVGVTATTGSTVLTRLQRRGQLEPKKPQKLSEDEGSLRVSAFVLDKMVKSMGEINISRSRMGMNVDIAKLALRGLSISLEQMYGYLRQVEMEAERQMSAGEQTSKRDQKFDALQMDTFTQLQELTRRVSEAQNDVLTHHTTAVAASRDMEEALATQNILASELSNDIDQIRQVRVSSIVPSLKRVVRSACRDTGKRGEIFFDADVEIDRGILSKIMSSLEHILRNAVAHGIENPERRVAAGKDTVGVIEFRAFQDGGEVVIEIRDDGHGMDVKHIHEIAIKKGVVKADVQMSDAQIRDLIFEPGFSTVDQVSDISGRGVGLDVVRSDISSMGGRIELVSSLGAGTIISLRVPATMTVIAGTAVTTNGHMYVVPVAFVDRLVRINAKELASAYQSKTLFVVDEYTGVTSEYEFWGLWQIAGAKSWDSTPLSRNSILLMRNDKVAVHIDDIRPAAEFVFRPLGPQIASNSGLIGSTISAAGNASLVLDPSRVSRALRSLMKVGLVEDLGSISSKKKAPLIMVVDDSMTVRKVTARLLKKEGFRVVEAENGLKALEVLLQEMPDVILMDIEMPVMNGFDASQAIRATTSTAHIPIIMITSRVGDSHRQRAMEIGIRDYLGKPYNEAELMEIIRKYTLTPPIF